MIAGLRAVADRGLTFDLLIRPHQLDAAARAVRAVPDGRFVLDHLAKPPIASRTMEPWAGLLAELAASPNVSAKVSGLVTEADWSSWTVQDLQPYVAHALECFGPDRLMFGSDWPVCTLAASYTQVVDATSDAPRRADPGRARRGVRRDGSARLLARRSGDAWRPLISTVCA